MIKLYFILLSYTMILFKLYFHVGHHVESRPVRCGVISFVVITGGANDIDGGLIGVPLREGIAGEGEDGGEST